MWRSVSEYAVQYPQCSGRPTTDLPQILALARKVLIIDDNVQEYRVTSLLNSRTGLASIAMACKHLDATRSYTIMKAIAKWTNGSTQTVHYVTKFLARDKESLELMTMTVTANRKKY